MLNSSRQELHNKRSIPYFVHYNVVMDAKQGMRFYAKDSLIAAMTQHDTLPAAQSAGYRKHSRLRQTNSGLRPTASGLDLIELFYLTQADLWNTFIL